MDGRHVLCLVCQKELTSTTGQRSVFSGPMIEVSSFCQSGLQALCPTSGMLKNTLFWNLDLFDPQVRRRGRCLPSFNLGKYPVSKTLCSLEYWMMGKVWKLYSPKCYTPLSEPFRIHMRDLHIPCQSHRSTFHPVTHKPGYYPPMKRRQGKSLVARLTLTILLLTYGHLSFCVP
jgi:hypothetical protein